MPTFFFIYEVILHELVLLDFLLVFLNACRKESIDIQEENTNVFIITNFLKCSTQLMLTLILYKVT